MFRKILCSNLSVCFSVQLLWQNITYKNGVVRWNKKSIISNYTSLFANLILNKLQLFCEKNDNVNLNERISDVICELIALVGIIFELMIAFGRERFFENFAKKNLLNRLNIGWDTYANLNFWFKNTYFWENHVWRLDQESQLQWLAGSIYSVLLNKFWKPADSLDKRDGADSSKLMMQNLHWTSIEQIKRKTNPTYPSSQIHQLPRV